ncbi:hypothetical protein [Thalassobacillus sp. C254]|uniref:hypothetical protein n=1 Tax=Thalassobacillus sp. C254 TaxID=1225341 RepID=UPI0006CF6F09|nr:hypothetical protein [Thalassobacillus sp. C254]
MIYIPFPSRRYKEDSNQSEINVKEELNLLNEFESVYSVIEYQGEPSGQVYEKYKGYLDNTRKRIEILSEEKKVIEEKNAEDIKT